MARGLLTIRTVGWRVALPALLSLAAAAPASAATIKVTTTADEFGAGPGCGLREAIQAANGDTAFGGCHAGSDADEIRLAKGASYARALDGNDEDLNAIGDLDVASKIAIGPRKGKATIDAGGMDRGIDVLAGGDLTLSRVLVTGASETYPPAPAIDGAGIRSSGRLKLSRVRVAGNETLGNGPNNGGGLSLRGTAIIDRSTITGNTAANVGGGIFFGGGEGNQGGSLRITRSTIAGNHSGYVGGGIYLGDNYFQHDTAAIRDSTVSANRADSDGGGVYVSMYGIDGDQSDEATLTNVTISGNRSNASGGGIYQYVGNIDVNSATITGNSADDDGGGGSDQHGGGIAGFSIAFFNSIVSGNIDLNPVDPQPDCDGPFSGGHNVIGSEAECGKTDGDKVSADPRLGPLKRNGGPTATHALKKDSPAIGRAGDDAPKKDQRGVKRDNRPDSGAYERD